MKFIKLLKLSLFLPVLVFSFEIEFEKKFTQSLPHDTLSTFLKVTIKDESEILVKERLEVFRNLIKNNQKVKSSLGSFYIKPEYRYSKSAPKIISYIGEMKYRIDSVKAEEIHEFISNITDLKRNRDTIVAVNNLSWSVKEKTYNMALENLQLEAIVWAEKYVKSLSSDIKKECKIKSITINKMDEFAEETNENIYSSSDMSKVPRPLLEANQEKIKINTKYVLECE